jgi:hypothetical protein
VNAAEIKHRQVGALKDEATTLREAPLKDVSAFSSVR